jgi:UDP-N-acetylmuramate--alanine ligase
VRLSDVVQRPEGSRATLTLPDVGAVTLHLQLPGLHNLRNAAAALAVVRALDADHGRAAAALAEFGGAARRFERVGEIEGVTVIDDYAHHPSEVRVTLAAARQAFPDRRIVAVFQPHLFSRTALHGDALGRELAAADVVVVAPIYAAREQPLPGVTAAMVANGARTAGRVPVLAERDALAARVAEAVRPGDVVLTLGAGDITQVSRDLLGLLQQRAAGREQVG